MGSRRFCFPVLIVVLFLHAEPATAADRGALRLLVVASDERLPSEQKALAQLEKRLAKQWTGALWVQTADADELGAARELIAGTTPKTAPTAWSGAEVVVILELLPPTGKKPKRITRGLGAIVVVRPPGLTPIFAQRIEGTADLSLAESRLQEWLARLVVIVAGAQ
jgi:hypothetical protein